MHILMRLICVGFLLAFPAFSVAETQKWYQIELIVFSHLTSQNLTLEQWPQVIPKTSPNVVSLKSPASSPQSDDNYQLVARQYLALNEEANLLNRQSGYKVLLHTAWIQKVNGPKQALPIKIVGGNLYNVGSNSQPQINGTITISLRRYFDVQFSLYFAERAQELNALSPNGYFSNLDQGLAYFHLLQTRRMRSNELNYISYPLYGVLIKIIPINRAENT